LTTLAEGSVNCSACDATYYFDDVTCARLPGNDSLGWVGCCAQCDGDKGHDCRPDNKGGELLTLLPLKQNWWRASKTTAEGYRCELDDACAFHQDDAASALGENNASSSLSSDATFGDGLCRRGHKGALCGACESRYYLDGVLNRCRKCRERHGVVRARGSPGRIAGFACVAVLCLAFLLVLIRRYGVKALVASFLEFLLQSDKLTGQTEVEHALAFAGDHQSDDDDDDEEEKEEEKKKEGTTTQKQQQKQQRRATFWRSVMTKTKCVVAAYQIINGMRETLPQVRFARLFDSTMRVLDVVAFDVIDIVSFDCVARLNYYERLVAQTLVFPLALVAVVLAATVFLTPQNRRFTVASYVLLAISYLLLPRCSSFAFQYFSCRTFDLGENRGNEKYLVVDSLLKCRGPRYRRWAPIAVLAIAIWPVGVPLLWTTILWNARRRINPAVVDGRVVRSPTRKKKEEEKNFDDDKDDDDDDVGKDAKARLLFAVSERKKIRLRDDDESLRPVAFLVDEYRPTMYLFPIFDGVRRIFLAGILVLFLQGSGSQIAIGLLGAAVSQTVYSGLQPYIERDDNLVADASQIQVSFMFFAALLDFMSREIGEKEAFFNGRLFGALLLFVYFGTFLVVLVVVLVGTVGTDDLQTAYRSATRRGTTKKNLELADLGHSAAGDTLVHCQHGGGHSSSSSSSSENDAKTKDEDPL